MTVFGVRMLRFGRAALAIDPSRIAAAIVFFLPNGHAMLDLIDDEAAGVKGFAAMCGAHAHPHRHLSQPQGTDAVDAQSMLHREAAQRFGDYALTFLHREFLKSFVFESSDFLAIVLVAYPTLEINVAAGAEVLKLAPCACAVDGRLGKAEAHQPPATGGMNTTASLATSLRDQSLNSLLTATFNCSRDSVKP